MKKYVKFVFVLMTLVMILAPAISSAQGWPGLVPCGRTDPGVLATNPEYADPCEFKHIMILINKVINFILFYLAVPIAAIMFAYAGFLLLFNGGESNKRTTAKNIFMNVAIGLVLAAAAWLIINTLLSILGFDGSWIGFQIGI